MRSCQSGMHASVSAVDACIIARMAVPVTRRPRLGFSYDDSRVPYPTPPPGGRLRIAFAGQATYFRATSLDEESARIQTRYFEFREGRDPNELTAGLRAFAPHVVIVFRPEPIPAGPFPRPRYRTR